MLNKLKNNKFLTSTLILLIGGFFSKFLGFIIKIIITRLIGEEGVGLYSLITPTFGLFITIATLSFPTAICKLVSEKNRSPKKVIFSIIPISILLNLFCIFLLFLISKPLSYSFLKNKDLYYPIICIGFTLPFIGLSSIVKGYFWGRQKMGVYILSNIGEQIARLIILSILVPIFIKKSIVSAISVIILVNIISESISIVIMLLGLNKKVTIHKEDLIVSRKEVKDILSISLPSTTSKIVASTSHFLEPIILTNALLFIGYSSNFIVKEYGIINAYSLSLLLIPQFFTQSISTSLIPEVSKYYSIGNLKMCRKRIKQISYLSLLIGLVSSTILIFKSEFFLNLIYKTTLGSNYIKLLVPFSLACFLEGPLNASLEAMNKSKDAFTISLKTSILKLFLLCILSLLNIKMYSLIISITISIIIKTYLLYKKVNTILHPLY